MWSMRWRMACVVLLIGMVVAAAFAAGGPRSSGGASAQDANATPVTACGNEDFRVVAFETPGPGATPEPVPDGLFRSVDQVLGPLVLFQFSGTPTLNTHVTSIGVFCLEAGGTVPVGNYGDSLNMIAIPGEPAGTSLHFTLEGLVEDADPATTDTGWVEICRSVDGVTCSSTEVINPPVGEFDLNAGESARLVNVRFGLNNPGATEVAFWVTNVAPGSGGCPTKCWISP